MFAKPTNKLAAFFATYVYKLLAEEGHAILHFLTIVFTKLTLQLRK